MQKFFLGAGLSIAALMASAANPAQPLGGFAYGQQQAPDGTEWENPQALALNKEQPRAYMFPFASVDNAKKVLPENSEYFMSLDGTWKFNWVGNPSERPADFYKTDYSTANWDDIVVPGCWNVQGIQKDGSQKYGTPIYVNQPAPFVTELKPDDWRKGVMRTPGDTTCTVYKNRNEVGSYVRTFTVPADWKGREVYINFDGVDSFFYLWINGQYVGFSKNSRNTASFNITPYLNKKGENKVAVEVYRYSDAAMLENQDMFRLPGIIRSTYLTSTPQLQIRDMAVRTTIPAGANGLKADGYVNVQTTLRNLGKKAAKGLSMKYEVFPVELYSDKTGKEAIAPVISAKTELAAGGSTMVETDFTIPGADLWSAERPNRYVLVAQLLDAKGKVIETTSTYFGVRQVEIRDTPADKDEFGLAGRYFYVNNMPVKLKGVNRHENNLTTGHTLSREQMQHEVMLMKQYNINHVRNSHYNDDPYWYYLTDKYGIYLEDEANLESHEYHYGPASLSHPIEWKDAHVARNMEMVHAHVNHPSIVIWSLGNEAGPGQNFVYAYDAIKAYDTSRPVQYERANEIVDMGSNQYPSIAWTREAVTGKYNIKYPFHISEYAHSMGNALGNFAEYWDAIESTNFLCGGAIWDWVDQALWNYTPDGTRYMAYGGDFGDKPNQGMFCMNGIMFPDFTPKPQAAEVKRIHQYVGVKPVDITKGEVEIFNKNYYTDLSDLSPRWILTRNGVEVKRGDNVNRPRMNVGPRQSQNWTIPFGYDEIAADSLGEYFLTLQFLLNEDKPWAKAGYVQAEVQLPVKSAAAFAPIAVEGYGALTLTEGADTDKISGDFFDVEFDNATGTISSLTYNGKQIITPGNGPVLNALRAPVDNDVWARKAWFANGLHNLQHKATAHKATVRPDGAIEIQYRVESQAPQGAILHGGGEHGVYSMTPVERPFDSLDFHFSTNQVWTVYPDGSIELQSAIDSNRPNLFLPRIGYSMTLPAEFANYTYYGRGPENNFNDRDYSQQIGLYKSTVADQFVPFPKPQSMGNREQIRWNALTDNAGDGVMFVALGDPMSASALPWDDMEMATAAHPYQLPASKGTTLHIDKKVLGLGGNSCGQGGPLPEDCVQAGPTTFGFLIRPVDTTTDLQASASVAGSGKAPLIVSRDRVGNVTIASGNPNARIEYNVVPLGMQLQRPRGRKMKSVSYSEPFNLRDGGTVTAWAVDDPTNVTTVKFDKIEKLPIVVVDNSSTEPNEGDADHLLDRDPSTIWHTMYSVTMANFPHWIVFDCSEVRPIKGFTYLHRENGNNGDVKGWRMEVSNDRENWTTAGEGEFSRSKDLQTIEFAEPVTGRYVRFTAVSGQNPANDFASGAELDILFAN